MPFTICQLRHAYVRLCPQVLPAFPYCNLSWEQGYMPTLKDYVPYLRVLTTVQFSLLLTEASPSKFPPLLTSLSFHMYTALSVRDKK